EEFEKLSLRGEELTTLENNKPQWLEVERVYSRLREEHETYSQRFHAMFNGASIQLEEKTSMQSECVEQFNKLKDALNSLKASAKQADSNVKVHSGELKRAQRDLQELEDKLTKAKSIHAGYGSFTTAEIVVILREELEELREK